MDTLSNLLNNFNGISLAVIMILSYCAVLKILSVIMLKQNESLIVSISKA